MQTRAQKAAAPVFALTMFFSAALIFILQPMFARMTTPLLGGSPAVWNTSMVFFQAALLLGYAYAHGLARVKSLQRQVIVHGLVLLAGCVVLPIKVSTLLGAPDPSAPSLWLFGVLTLSVGLPYAAASATAPLLQYWFSRTGRPDAGDPYYLYAASNLGSLLGLLAYPVVLEPLLGLSDQSVLWSIAYVVLIGCVVASAWAALASNGSAAVAVTPTAGEGGASLRTRWLQRLYWIAAAAVPSSLLLGVTTHISTDVASAPFLWVVPLALYLVTFVLAFARSTQFLQSPAAILFAVGLAGIVFAFGYVGFIVTLVAHLSVFFLAALVCHFALAQARPSADRLTEFYMFVSTGGVVGGALTALAAPMVFNDVFEYPLALAAAAFFLPKLVGSPPRWMGLALVLVLAIIVTLQLSAGIPAALDVSNSTPGGSLVTALLENNDVRMGVALLVLGGLAIGGMYVPTIAAGLAMAAIGTLLLMTFWHTQGQLRAATFPLELIMFLALLVCGCAVLSNHRQPTLAAAIMLVAFAMMRLDDANTRSIVFQERSFFGVTRVQGYGDPGTDDHLRVMVHGTTTHGAQYVQGPFVTEPLTYYNIDTGLGFATAVALDGFQRAHLGLIGLGAGATACLKRGQDTLTIYEIDPKIIRLSVSKGLEGIFTYVPRCAPDARIVLGDGRLGVRKETDGALDVLVVDAFSSDAVPAHLLTREAMREYMQKMSPNGVVILHLSNRNLDLASEASRVAQAEGLAAVWADTPGTGSEIAYGTTTMVVARNQAVLDALQLNLLWDDRHHGPGSDAQTTWQPMSPWKPIEALEGRAWSDDYVNFLRPLMATLAPPPDDSAEPAPSP